MNQPNFRYSSARVMPFAPPFAHAGPGNCRSCGQPSTHCNCGCRECRKEPKELLVESTGGNDRPLPTGAANTFRMMADLSANVAAATPTPGAGKAFIGGGCCVHLSVEYAPVAPTAASTIGVLVHDTEGTTLAWIKVEQPGGHYQVKENVVTTKPGATLTVIALNATVRVRWCEVFSC